MKNLTILITCVLCLIFACQNASDKIKENTSKQIEKPQTNSDKKETSPINAQIIDNSGSASFEWTNDGGTVWNFGTIKQGDSPEFTFTFKNIGNEPMIISNAKGSCGCTVPQWPRQPIPVGGTGEIKVQFDSSNKPGQQNKVVTITANTESKVKKLLIRATVK